jgi:hypothetical protein
MYALCGISSHKAVCPKKKRKENQECKKIYFAIYFIKIKWQVISNLVLFSDISYYIWLGA